MGKAKEFKVSKQSLRKAEGAELVRLRREEGKQSIGYSSRPFVLCGLPIRRPSKGTLIHRRRNGKFLLEVTGHPEYGLPFGQDRLIPLFLSTVAVRRQTQVIRFASAAEMLEMFDLDVGGAQYRRLIAGFERVFGATIYFGSDTQTSKARVIRRKHFNFIKEIELWYERDPKQRFLPGDFRNVVVLSDEFYSEVINHPIPTDLNAIKVLAGAPAVLDLLVFLSYRCHASKGEERIPLFGAEGLVHQLGTAEYSRERRFRQKLDQWLGVVRGVWPECPAMITADGGGLLVRPAVAIHPQGAVDR